MSFWSWMRERYPKEIIAGIKGCYAYLRSNIRSNLNLGMFFIGILGCCAMFVMSLSSFLLGYIQDGLIHLGLTGVGFILANYGWYRQYG